MRVDGENLQGKIIFQTRTVTTGLRLNQIQTRQSLSTEEGKSAQSHTLNQEQTCNQNRIEIKNKFSLTE